MLHRSMPTLSRVGLDMLPHSLLHLHRQHRRTVIHSQVLHDILVQRLRRQRPQKFFLLYVYLLEFGRPNLKNM